MPGLRFDREITGFRAKSGFLTDNGQASANGPSKVCFGSGRPRAILMLADGIVSLYDPP